MIKNRKQSLIVIGAFILTLLLGTTTYAFFNYTRTGSANTIRTGRISFSTNQNNTINLTNVFPMTSTEADNANIDALTIIIDGDTTYSDGEEYLVSITDVNNNVNNKRIPVSYIATYVAQDNKSIGESSNNYFNERETGDIYSLTSEGIVDDDEVILVGHINSGNNGVHGILTIKAYIDEAKVGISDTYPAEETDTNSDGYIDGTPSSFGENKTIFTTDEWNSLTTNSISFKIKVEANEGVWVEENINTMNYISYPRDPEIKEIRFIKESASGLQQRYADAVGVKNDITYNNEGMVLAWREDDILYIGSTGTTYLLTGSGLFSGFTSVEKVVFENVNSSRVTTMAGMFNGCNNLKEVNIEVLDASNVTSMNRMFYNCYHLESVNLGPMNAKNVEDVDYLFAGCNLLEEANISNIGNDNLSAMSLFLSGCISLKKLIANGFNFGTSAMSYTFTRATNLEILDLSNAKNIDFYYAFDGMTKLREINFAGASLRSSAHTMQAAFRGCTSLTSLDLSSLDLSYLTVTVNAFYNCSNLETIYVSNNSFDLDINTYSDYMFYGCTSLVGGSGTTFDSSHNNVEYAIIDGGQDSPGYLTLKTN